jgi:hypothetical protein
MLAEVNANAKRVKNQTKTQMKSKTLERILEEMKNDPWHVKLRRWWSLRLWVWTCRTRWIWDLSYERNIFRKKL